MFGDDWARQRGGCVCEGEGLKFTVYVYIALILYTSVNLSAQSKGKCSQYHVSILSF